MEENLHFTKNKILRYIGSISEIVYVDNLDDIVNGYNYTHHRTIKMKPEGVKSSTYTDVNVENKDKVPKNIISKLVWRNFCDSKS